MEDTRWLTFYYFFNSSHPSILEADLDSVGMMTGTGEHIFNHTPGKFTTMLIFFENNQN